MTGASGTGGTWRWVALILLWIAAADSLNKLRMRGTGNDGKRLTLVIFVIVCIMGINCETRTRPR